MNTFNLIMAGSTNWLSVDEAATYLGKSKHWLYQNRIKLQIPHSQIGGTFRFNKSQLDEWIVAKQQGSTIQGLQRKSLKRITL